MAEQLGTTKLKQAVKFACDFTKQMAETLKDGKFHWTESFGFFDELLAVPNLVKSWPEVKKEVEDLSDEEKGELYEYLKEEFNLPNDKLEVMVEDSLAWVMYTLSLIGQWKSL